MHRIEKYQQILGLTESVNEAELRKIYRERAKELHPDINKHPESHDQFLLLNEAYEFYHQLLIQLGGLKKEHFLKSKKYPEHYYTEKWNIEKRMAARRQASKRAKMKYEQFEKMGYHKTLDKMFFFFDVLRFIMALVLLIGLPIFLFVQEQISGLIIALFVQLITYRLWSRALRRFISSA